MGQCWMGPQLPFYCNASHPPYYDMIFLEKFRFDFKLINETAWLTIVMIFFVHYYLSERDTYRVRSFLWKLLMKSRKTSFADWTYNT